MNIRIKEKPLLITKKRTCFFSRDKLVYSGFVIIILSVFSLTIVKAQDSIKIKTIFTTIDLVETYRDSSIAVDTNLDLFAQYNPVYNHNNFYVNTGDIGSPHQNLLLESRRNLGFDIGLHQFDLYELTSRNIKFYDTYTPHTEISYVQGKNEMQSLKALHSRNINPFWNATILYKNLLSDGFYSNQKSEIKNIGVNTSFKTRNSRYSFYVSAIMNKFKMQENGGVQSDSLFEGYTASNKLRALTNLTQAKQELDNEYYSLTQILKFGKFDKETDTTTGEVTRSDLSGKAYGFQHDFAYKELKYKYADSYIDSLYYGNIFLDSFATDDRIKFSEFSNKLFLFKSNDSIQNGLLKGLVFRLGATFNVGSIIQDTIDSSFYNLGSFIFISKKIGKGELIFDLNYFQAGSNKNDFCFEESFKFIFWRNSIIQIGANQLRKSPNYIFTNIYSNHLQWNNSFDPVITYSFYSSISNQDGDLYIKGSYNLLQNWIYFSKDIIPEQYDKEIGYVRIQLSNDLILGKFHINNNFVYQYVSNSKIIKLPYWLLNSLVYYENNFFENNLYIQVGFDTKIRDAYIANSYYAPFSIFYLQQRVFLGVYPKIDVFASASIKKLRFFLKYEHVNQGFPNDKYYSLPHYPYNPRVFRFGFSWLFYD